MMKKRDEVMKNYSDLLNHTDQQLESLIYELENEALHNDDLRAFSLEMAMDSVPLIRHLKEAKKQLAVSKDIYQ
jgi:hypothetical protein